MKSRRSTAVGAAGLVVDCVTASDAKVSAGQAALLGMPDQDMAPTPVAGDPDRR